MGCDIHLYKEKMVDGKWVSADEGWCDEYDEGYVDVPYENRFTGRDYDLFGLLCDGVRRNHPFAFKERGLPFNTCEEVKSLSDKWGSDGHSHSYIYLHELNDVLKHLQDSTIKISGMMRAEQLSKLSESISSPCDTNWDLIYPYCQSTNAKNFVGFELDVPAKVFLGDGLNQIIKSFDDVDGDNQRVVFWFDN